MNYMEEIVKGATDTQLKRMVRDNDKIIKRMFNEGKDVIGSDVWKFATVLEKEVNHRGIRSI